MDKVYKVSNAGKYLLYNFGGGQADGDASMANWLGGKGAGLCEMSKMGIPVPPGFTVPTIYSVRYMDDPEGTMTEVMPLVYHAYHAMAQLQGVYPLMVSVRSGAPISMPGMMDTILNVGLTIDGMDTWISRIGWRSTLDCRRRLIQMLGSTAYGIPSEKFEALLTKARFANHVKEDRELSVDALENVVSDYMILLQDETKTVFPNTVEDQLRAAVEAVFKSWNNERARIYRDLNGIDHKMGTAVTVQTMVFGNMNDNSGSGVLFTRHSSTGENIVQGEFLPNAQGEDVVAGIRTPLPLSKLSEKWPTVATEIAHLCSKLEDHYLDMMDVEFTIQDGALYVLQCRVGKRSPLAKLVIAHDFWAQEAIDLPTALSRMTRADIRSLLRPQIDPSFTDQPRWVGIAGCPGVARGVAVLTAQQAIDSKVPCILVRDETDPDDIGGMHAAVGVLTRTGGATSHAAVVALAMNRPCVVGCTSLPDLASLAGHMVTVDGATGRVWMDVEVPLVDASARPELNAFARAIALKDDVRLAMPSNVDAKEVAHSQDFYMAFDGKHVPFMGWASTAIVLDTRIAPMPHSTDGLTKLFDACPELPLPPDQISLLQKVASDGFHLLASKRQKVQLGPLSYYNVDSPLTDKLGGSVLTNWLVVASNLGADPDQVKAALATVVVEGSASLVAVPPAYLLMSKVGA